MSEVDKLRRQWQACLVQARAALLALRKAEAAYVAAHRARLPAAAIVLHRGTPENQPGRRRMPRVANLYPGA